MIMRHAVRVVNNCALTVSAQLTTTQTWTFSTVFKLKLLFPRHLFFLFKYNTFTFCVSAFNDHANTEFV